MYTRTKLITPKEANEMLKGNTSNRTVSQTKVASLASDMMDGKFVANGESISFSPSGKLLNGQHRLLACVKSGVTFETVVAYDVPEEHFWSFDNTKTRKAADAFGIEGEDYPVQLQSTLNMLYQYEKGTLGVKAGVGTTQQTIALAGRHPDIRKYVALGSKFPAQKNVVAAALYIAHEIEGKGSFSKCEEFVNGLQSGEDLKKGSPVKRLRDKFISNTRLPRKAAIGLTFSAVYSFLGGKTLEQLRPMVVPISVHAKK